MNGHSHELEENFRQYINIFYTNYRPVLLQYSPPYKNNSETNFYKTTLKTKFVQNEMK